LIANLAKEIKTKLNLKNKITMDSNYIIGRLKSTRYQYPTVDFLRTRLKNLEENKRQEIISRLKIELWKERNNDIHEPLQDLLYRMPIAS